MILDRLETSLAYAQLGTRFASALAYLRETDLENVPDGTYEVQGRDVFAIVQTYPPKPRAQGRWEAHRDYADIQHIIAGEEVMGVTPMGTVRSEAPYDPAKDLEFFIGDEDTGQFFHVEAGSFAIFLPHDIHMPSLAVDDRRAEMVKKIVMKVRLR